MRCFNQVCLMVFEAGSKKSQQTGAVVRTAVKELILGGLSTADFMQVLRSELGLRDLPGLTAFLNANLSTLRPYYISRISSD